MNFDNQLHGSEGEVVEALMSHLEEAEPSEPPAEAGDGGDDTPPTQEAESAELEAEGEQSDAPSEPEAEIEQEPQTFTVKVNGEEQSVTLDDLQKGYMKDADYRRKTSEVAEQKKQIAQESAERFQQLDQHLAELSSLIQVQEKETDWDELRDLDPSEYMRQKELLDKRKAASEKAAEEHRKAYTEQMKAIKAEESEKLNAAIPDWLDGDLRKQEMAGIRETLSEVYGFQKKEIDGLIDHRLIVLARDAYKGRAAAAKAEQKMAETKRKVEEAPPLQKPKSNGGKPSQAERVAQLKSRARKGDADAAVELFEMGL